MSIALDAALNRLVLEQGYGLSHGQSLREWAMERLKMHGELNDLLDQYVRLRIALSLCPVSALTHTKSERLSRKEKIEHHLVQQRLANDDDVKHLASIVDAVIGNWLTERINVSSFRAALITRDGTFCNSCHVNIEEGAENADSVTTKDPYKLTWVQPERSLAYTVDHRDPVSKFGTNDVTNLELLCRYCNEGKEDGSPLLLKHEVELATQLPVIGTTNAHLLMAKSAKLVYRIIRRDQFKCTVCSASNRELTVRKTVAEGLAVMSNLQAICYPCIVEPTSQSRD